MPITTSPAAICAADPCKEGIRKLLEHVGKTMTAARADTTELPVLTVLESNGLDDALWVLDKAVGNKRICRLFAADCAERVHYLYAAVCPDDDRPMNAIRVARDPNATDEQKDAARAAARAAARDAFDAASDAAWAAAWAARDASDAASDGVAARAAAWVAARAAARTAAWDVSDVSDASDAAWAASDAAGAAQKARLRQYLIHGEAASDMPWPDAAETAAQETA